MGAIYGSLGEIEPSELGAMADRLAYRGRALREESPATLCRIGQRSEADPPASIHGLPLVVHGFVDNAPELRASLELPEDTPLETLLWRLVQTHGPIAGGRQLAGEFAIAYWDGDAGRLVLLRDRFGAIPLYQTRLGGRFFFASSYKALLGLPDLPARPYLSAFRHLQCTRYPLVEASLLDGVKPVARGAATFLEPAEASQRVESFMESHLEIASRDAAGHAALLRDTLLSSVRRQIRGFDSVGVQLSGGFDSAFVLGAVKAVAPEVPVHTFTAGYGEDDFEIQAAGDLARYFGTTHHPMVIQPEEVGENLPATVWHMDDPYGREEMVQCLLLVREASRHVRLLMAGYGADMTMGGMPRHRLAHLALTLPILGRPLAMFHHYTQTGLVPRSLLVRALIRGYHGAGLLPPPKILGTDYEPPFDPLEPEGPEPLSAHLATVMSEDCGWEAYEGVHAAEGVRFNAPFMDPTFIAATRSVPDAFKIRGRRQKLALRLAGEGLLPDSLLERKKTFQRLQHDLRFAEMLDRLAADLLSPGAVRARGLFDPAEVERIRRRAPRSPYSTHQAHRLWTLIQSELWCRIFLDGRGAPLA